MHSFRWAMLVIIAAAGQALAAPTPCAVSAFSRRAMPGKSDAERHREYLRRCALDEVVALTSALVRFETVSAQVPASKSPAFAAMGAFLHRWAIRQGLSFREVGPRDVFEIGLGRGPLLLGFSMHGDVVPAPSSEWTHSPFEPVIEDGKLYGRGTHDDKGAIAGVLVGMAVAKRLGMVPKGKVLAIIGNGEESDWSGMKTYIQTQPQPKHVVSIDGGYPVVVAQSGFVQWALEANILPLQTGQDATRFVATDASAGEFLTQIPGTARLRLEASSPDAGARMRGVLEAAISALAKERAVHAQVRQEEGALVVEVHGKAVHSSMAEEGDNALWHLSALARKLPLAQNGISVMLDVVATMFDGDHGGEKLGIAYGDPLMGRLVVAPTVLRVKDGRVQLDINMRRPQGKTQEAFKASLDEAAKRITLATKQRVVAAEGLHIGAPVVTDTQGPLVSTLLGIYRRHQGKPDAKPQSIRGGTYARLWPGAVDFGPAFPDEPYTGHAADEFISLKSLQAVTELCGEAFQAVIEME